MAAEEDGDGGPDRGARATAVAVAVAAVDAGVRALRRRRLGSGGLPRVDFLQILYENVVFYLLWVIESVIVLAKLCFFFLRFSFRL